MKLLRRITTGRISQASPQPVHCKMTNLTASQIKFLYQQNKKGMVGSWAYPQITRYLHIQNYPTTSSYSLLKLVCNVVMKPCLILADRLVLVITYCMSEALAEVLDHDC